jgi:hypothetical protein
MVSYGMGVQAKPAVFAQETGMNDDKMHLKYQIQIKTRNEAHSDGTLTHLI